MNSYSLASTPSPSGLAITDAFCFEGNRRRPITFKQVGQVLDLNTVEASSFARSSMKGLIRNLFVAGTLAAVQVEVTEETKRNILVELGKLGMAQDQSSVAVADNTKVVSLEEGLMVAVSNLPDPPKHGSPEARAQEQIDLLEAAKPRSLAQMEDMSGRDLSTPAPMDSISLEGAEEETVAAVATEAAAKGEDGEEITAGNPFASWKAGKDFATQKAEILASEDREFLQYVIDNESKQFAKLAKTRLSEMGL
jgi:hypothetical protein